jgi:TRAP-type mannitol/chloroaromatic compound transport system permease small subunit
MAALLALSRSIDAVSDWIGKKVIWLIFASIMISATNAIVRKVFSISSNAWLEAQWYLFGAAFMLAAAYTLKENEHIRIDVVYGALSRKTRHRIDLFGHVFFLLPFAAIMTYMCVPYAYAAWTSGQVSSNAGGLIIWPARAVLAAGFALLLAQAISEIIKKVAVMQGIIEDPHPFVSAHEAAELEGAALAAEVARLAKEQAKEEAR